MSAPQEYAQLSTYLTATENLDLRNVSFLNMEPIATKLSYFIAQRKTTVKENNRLKLYLSKSESLKKI
jgi:hypothetical protein